MLKKKWMLKFNQWREWLEQWKGWMKQQKEWVNLKKTPLPSMDAVASKNEQICCNCISCYGTDNQHTSLSHALWPTEISRPKCFHKKSFSCIYPIKKDDLQKQQFCYKLVQPATKQTWLLIDQTWSWCNPKKAGWFGLVHHVNKWIVGMPFLGFSKQYCIL